MRLLRPNRLVVPALLGATAVAALTLPVGAQGWNPFPDRDPPNWSSPRRAPAPDQSREAQREAQPGWSPAPPSNDRNARVIDNQDLPASSEGRAGVGGQRQDEGASARAPAPDDPGPGRGRPPGTLGELRSDGTARELPEREASPRAAAPPPRETSREAPHSAPGGSAGSIIPDRQIPNRAAPGRQAMPRESIPGGYRPYYERSRPPATPAPSQAVPERSGLDRAGTDRGPSSRPAAGAPAGRPGTSVGEGFGQKSREVEAQDLAPVLGADGSRLPDELWRGIAVPEIEQLMSTLSIPPRSGAVHDLWRRLLIANSAEPSGGKTASHFLSLRLAALYKSGLLADLEKVTAAPAAPAKGGDVASGDLVLAVQRAKAQLGLGQRQAACESARSAEYKGEVPKPVARDALLLIAYCAAADGNVAAAGTTVDMAREQSFEAPLAFAIVDHLASGATTPPAKLAIPKDVSLIDYRFLELTKVQTGILLDRAEPALVAAMARELKADARTYVAAAEDAARLHALDAEALAKAYREASVPVGGDPLTAKLEPPLKRAALFQAIAAETAPARKGRLMQALLQEARSHTLYVPVARGLLAEVKGLKQTAEMAFFAETAVEITLAAGDYAAAVGWALLGSGAGQDRGADPRARGDGLMHWTTLIDIAGAKEFVPRGSGLKLTEELAVKGKFAPEVLHRLVTVLDALEYNIPIPLWEAASRTPQPAKGHLPETGVLGHLKTAAGEKKFALTVLLAMRALGPDGPEAAHIIALGDTIRALKLAGLEEDARRLGFEALFAAWPRGVGG